MQLETGKKQTTMTSPLSPSLESKKSSTGLVATCDELAKSSDICKMVKRVNTVYVSSRTHHEDGYSALSIANSEHPDAFCEAFEDIIKVYGYCDAEQFLNVISRALSCADDIIDRSFAIAERKKKDS